MIEPDGGAIALAKPDTRLFGEPVGLAFLAFTEAWERFSFYGMSALLVLYMTESLLLSGHVENVAGFPVFRAAIEAAFGPQTSRSLASIIYGLYSGLIYFTPVFGGMLADRVLGARRTVVLGAILMCLGHLAMALDVSFLIALLLLIIGCGCLKGNISAQVGSLYDVSDDSGRTRAFAIFSIGINVGAVVGPLACGLLAQLYGWHAGFALAGVLMLFGLATYLAGMRYLAPDKPRRRAGVVSPALAGGETQTVLLLILVIAVTIFQSIAYYQTTDIGLLWIRDTVDLSTPFGRMPVAWFNSVDSFVSIIAVGPLFALWRWQAANGGEPSDIQKITTGAIIATISSGLLAVASVVSPHGKVSVIWPLACLTGMGVAFLYYWPTLLALVTRKAPASVNATMLGAAFLSLFLGNTIMGWVGSFYDRLGAPTFWVVNTAIGAAGIAFALLLQPFLRRRPVWNQLPDA